MARWRGGAVARWRGGARVRVAGTCNPLAQRSATDGLVVELNDARDTLSASLVVDAVGEHVEQRGFAEGPIIAQVSPPPSEPDTPLRICFSFLPVPTPYLTSAQVKVELIGATLTRCASLVRPFCSPFVMVTRVVAVI